MPASKIAGKGSSVTYGGTTIPIKKWTPKHNRDLADSTDSDNYNSGSDMIEKSQIPTALQTELSLEGFFDLNSTSTAMIAQFYTAATPVTVVLTLKSGTPYGHGSMDMSDFTTSTPIDDIVSWTANMKSNGTFTIGS